MKVLLVNGSPHQNGSTATALNEVAKTLNKEGIETEIFFIGARAITPCQDCRACVRLKKCIINDQVNTFVDLAYQADGFVFGSPVHYASSSGILVPFLDRAFFSSCMADRCVFEHKPGAAVVCARRAGSTATLDQINKYFTISQMPIISGRYWNMVYGMNEKDVVKDLEGMQNLRFLARNMAWHLKCREIALKNGIKPPLPEQVTYTHFIRD